MDALKQIVVSALCNPIIQGILASTVLGVAGYIVHRTKTERDDKIFHAIEGIIFNAFNMAEKILPIGTNPNVQKLDIALKTFVDDYKARFGKEPPEDIIAYAKDEWAKIATELKKK